MQINKETKLKIGFRRGNSFLFVLNKILMKRTSFLTKQETKVNSRIHESTNTGFYSLSARFSLWQNINFSGTLGATQSRIFILW